MQSAPKMTLSIVSHGQAALVRPLLLELVALEPRDFEVVLTLNIPEDERPFDIPDFPMTIVRNTERKGFGANHNAAFHTSRAPYFAVVNPDVRLGGTRPSSLLAGFTSPRVAICAPVVTNSRGEVEDSARHFPTWKSLFCKALGKSATDQYPLDRGPIAVEWVAGMFAVFRREAFADVGGFDDRRFFMYYEDVDICHRLQHRQWTIMLQPDVRIVHDAQRASHRNAQHMRWHATSIFRFLTGW